MFFYPASAEVTEDPQSLRYKVHVSNPCFGEGVNVNNILQDIITSSPKLTSIDSQLLLLDIYETGYNIFDHSNVIDKPLALVALHWSEESSSTSALYERIQQFVDRQVHTKTGLSLDKFLELPRDVCIKILEISAKEQKIEDNIANNLTNRLNNISK